MAEVIISRPATQAYRDGWERVFGKSGSVLAVARQNGKTNMVMARIKATEEKPASEPAHD